MRAVRRAALPIAATVALYAADATAVAPHPAHAGRPSLEVRGGVEAGKRIDARPTPVVATRTPRAARAAWARFTAAAPGGWLVQWHPGRGTPSRIWGLGIAAPGSVARGATAIAFARALLADHADLLAPGSRPDEFTVVADDLDGGLRTIGFRQTRHGFPVRGGQLSFRFKADRLIAIGSEALPNVDLAPPRAIAPLSTMRAAARTWLVETSPVAASATIVGLEGPMVLPLAGGRWGYRWVYRVVADAADPVGQWAVYVDASSAEPIAREQTLMFADGGLALFVPERYPGAGRLAYPAMSLDLAIDGVAALANAAGAFSWPGAALANVAVSSLTGPLADVENTAGPEADLSFAIDPGQTFLWDASDEEHVDSQLSVFVHAQKAKAYAQNITPEMVWLSGQLDAFVNIDNSCNAFSDGNTINFYRATGECENTGRIADVVYHEFGHAYHMHSILPGVGAFEGALSEGVSDYLAATITGDSAMGRGFTYTAEPLREIDPVGFEHVWPDDLIGEVHYDGLIIAGALWDLRKLLVEKLGSVEGVARADHLFQQGMRRAVDIPSMYPEVLAANDDDGDLDNGTPDACEINRAFGLHGLRALPAEISDFGVVGPDVDGYEVALEIQGLFASCPGDGIQSATLGWRVEDKPAQAGAVTLTPELVGGVTKLAGLIPQQSAGSVVRYQVELMMEDGAFLRFPDNPADPEYQLYVGKVVPLYCTDFEVNPEQEGWTHQLDQGEFSVGADDWQFGFPGGNAANGDPTEPFSGNRVFGNDLSLQEQFNGLYQSDKINSATTPVIETEGYTDVRLQYRRWLNVEDGFFDQASIYANDELVWANRSSGDGDDSDVHHRDKEWRFHDVALSDAIGDDDTVQIKFEIASDGGLEFGGWTLDELCVVALDTSVDPDPCEGGDCGGAGGGGGAGASAAQPGPAAEDDGGCGCRAVGAGDRSNPIRGAALVVAAIAAAWAGRRRRRV